MAAHEIKNLGGCTNPDTAAGVLPRYLTLYTLIFAAYGIEAPFLPVLLAKRGLSATAIGLVFAAGTLARLLSAPMVAFAADRLGAPRLLLSALFGCGFALAGSFFGLFLVSLLVSLALASVNPLADALASGAAQRAGGFSYGIVRGAGSAAFVGGTMLAGLVVAGGSLD